MESEILYFGINDLNDKDKNMLDIFIQNINLYDNNIENNYCKDADERLDNFLSRLLVDLNINLIFLIEKDLGRIDNNLIDYQKLFYTKKMFYNEKRHFDNIIISVESLFENIEKILTNLEKNKISLLKAISFYDTFYQYIVDFFKEFTLYKLAGLEKYKRYLNTISYLKLEAKIIKLKELNNNTIKFKNKLNIIKNNCDLLSLLSSKVLLLQNNNVVLIERINYSLINYYPEWKKKILTNFSLLNKSNSIKSKQIENIVNEYYTYVNEIKSLTEKSKHIIDEIDKIIKKLLS